MRTTLTRALAASAWAGALFLGAGAVDCPEGGGAQGDSAQSST
jgi:hypothetical protein